MRVMRQRTTLIRVHASPTGCCPVRAGCLWCAYGLATADYFVWCPNAFGALCGAAEALLCLRYPAKSRQVAGGGLSPAPGDALAVAIEKDGLEMRQQL